MSSSSERYDSDSSSSSYFNDKGNSDSEERKNWKNRLLCLWWEISPMETLPKVYVVVKQMKFQMNINFHGENFRSSLFLQHHPKIYS